VSNKLLMGAGVARGPAAADERKARGRSRRPALLCSCARIAVGARVAVATSKTKAMETGLRLMGLQLVLGVERRGEVAVSAKDGRGS
jgi:hypothetical protein